MVFGVERAADESIAESVAYEFFRYRPSLPLSPTVYPAKSARRRLAPALSLGWGRPHRYFPPDPPKHDVPWSGARATSVIPPACSCPFVRRPSTRHRPSSRRRCRSRANPATHRLASGLRGSNRSDDEVARQRPLPHRCGKPSVTNRAMGLGSPAASRCLDLMRRGRQTRPPERSASRVRARS
jgi:hypothetical protein